MIHIEILFDKNAKNAPKLPLMDALEQQIQKRIAPKFGEINIRIALSSMSTVKISGTKNKEQREDINQALEDLWMDDSWLPEID